MSLPSLTKVRKNRPVYENKDKLQYKLSSNINSTCHQQRLGKSFFYIKLYECFSDNNIL